MDDSRGVYNHEIVLPTKKYPIMLYFHADGLGYVAHHWHRSLEICDYINTPCRLWYGGRVMDLMPDTPIIINSGDIHSLTPQNRSDPRGQLSSTTAFLAVFMAKLTWQPAAKRLYLPGQAQESTAPCFRRPGVHRGWTSSR